MRRLVLAVLLLACACVRTEEPKVAPGAPPETAEAPPEIATLSMDAMASGAPSSETGQTCNAGLWKHVYHGQFATPKERLVPQKLCTTVTGTIMHGIPEKDGDWHIRLKLDAPYASMLNARNKASQHGHLVVEPMCANAVTQADTKQEKVCDGFSQTLYNPTMNGKRVSVTGAFVTDVEAGHGWNEIHPVSKITVIQ